jgi:hypothetical protein
MFENCTKSQRKTVIKAPLRESDFSKEYDETVIKKMQEMREMNQGRAQIRMGN